MLSSKLLVSNLSVHLLILRVSGDGLGSLAVINICSFVWTGLDVQKIDKCMGDPSADADNPVLKEEQDAQVIQYVNIFQYIQALSAAFCG